MNKSIAVDCEDSAIQIEQNLHKFRAFSELKAENKGGYIQASIRTPSSAVKITISLVTHDKNPHVNLLYVSPRDRMGCNVGELKPEDNVVRLEKVDDKWKVVVPQYWKELNSAHILGCNFWRKDTSELVLGHNALQITVCKAAQKVNSKTNINEMKRYLGIEDFTGEVEKVRLKVDFHLERAVTLISFSQVLFDRNNYSLEIEEIFNRVVCNKGDHVIVVNFNKSIKITKDKEISNY